jgi:predicted aspartyl protease
LVGIAKWGVKLRVEDGLLFAEVKISNIGLEQVLTRVVVDTGSSSTIFQTEALRLIGLTYQPSDEIHRIRGVGGAEFVFGKRIPKIQVGELETLDFGVEVGWMDYGFELQGILGLDFLRQTKAVIDLDRLELRRN